MAFQPYQAPFVAFGASPNVNQIQSGYPISNYQQPAYELSKYQPAVQMPSGNSIIWVQGEAGAKSYLVAPGASVLLMDSEGQRFYLKSTDTAGMPTMRVFEYTEIISNSAPPAIGASAELDNKYVTREEYNGLKLQYDDIIDRLSHLPTAVADSEHTAKNSKSKAKGGVGDEQSGI